SSPPGDIDAAAGRERIRALTAVGLLSRYYMDGWGPNHQGLVEGVAFLMEKKPLGKGGVSDLYYYYYATQVVHFGEGKSWKDWNEGPERPDGTRQNGMRDWLVNAQVRTDAKNPGNVGSWDSEAGWFGQGGGRLCTTAVALLTLEV